MKYAIILDTGSLLDSLRPPVKIFEETDQKRMDAYMADVLHGGNKCHVFEYKETFQIQTNIVSTHNITPSDR